MQLKEVYLYHETYFYCFIVDQRVNSLVAGLILCLVHLHSELCPVEKKNYCLNNCLLFGSFNLVSIMFDTRKLKS